MAEHESLYKIEPSYDSTIAVEIAKVGFFQRQKHVLVFERFSGQLHYSPGSPQTAKMEITIDPASVTCSDKWLKPRRAKQFIEYARSKALLAEQHPEIRFASTSIASKALRGFVAEGELRLRGNVRVVRANLIFGPQTNGRFQIDADAPIRLSDFGISPPSSLFGLIGTRDEAMVHLLLWASRISP